MLKIQMLTLQYNFLTKFYRRISFFNPKYEIVRFLRIPQIHFSFFQIKCCPESFSQDCRVSRYLPRLTLEKEANRWKLAKKGYLCDCLLPWQESAIYSYERKWNLRCVANLHCECQELKPKVEINTSCLVLHPSSGVDSVKTVGSHLKFISPAAAIDDTERFCRK